MKSLLKDVAMHPLRDIPPDQIENYRKEDVRPVDINDFIKSMKTVRPSVSAKSVNEYHAWH